MFKKLLSTFVAVLMILTFCSCSKDTGEGKQVVYPIDVLPTYLDPQIVTGEGNRIIVANCFEGLVRLDADGNIAPGVATSWDVSDGGLTYTFKLRDDAMWRVPSSAEDFLGENFEQAYDFRVTADDFVFAFGRALSASTGSAYAHDLTSIKNGAAVLNGTVPVGQLGVYAKDDKTLVINLETADSDFLYTLTTPVAMPCHRIFFEKTGGRYGVDSKHFISNGPFYISSWISDAQLTIKKSDVYAGEAQATASSVYFSINNQKETRLEKIKKGTYSVAPLTQELAAQAAENKKLTVYEYKNIVKSLFFNCTDTIASNRNLRLALFTSLNADLLLNGMEKADGIIPETCVANSGNYRSQAGAVTTIQPDNAKAKAFWNTALKELNVDKISLTVLCSTDDETAVKTALQDWQALFGISCNINVEAVDAETMKKRVENKSYQLVFYPLAAESTLALNTVSLFVTQAKGNIAGYSNAEFDSHIASIVKADLKSKTALLLAAEQKLINDAVVYPIANVSHHFASGEGVEGVYFNASGELVYFSQTLIFG